MGWGEVVALIALVVAIGGTLASFRHAESLVGRFSPISIKLKVDQLDINTKVRVNMQNSGPVEALNLSSTAYVVSRFRKELLRQQPVGVLRGGDNREIMVTNRLEKELLEKFGQFVEYGAIDWGEQGWGFLHSPKSFKLILSLSYLPAFPDSKWTRRRLYYTLKPQMSGERIANWEIKERERWLPGWLPWP